MLPEGLIIQKYKGHGNAIIIPEQIGRSAFYECEKLAAVFLPNGVKVIGEGAFEKCNALKEFQYPEGILVVKGIKGCKSLEEVKFPQNPVIFEGMEDCSAIKEIEIPSSVAEITRSGGPRNPADRSEAKAACSNHVAPIRKRFGTGVTAGSLVCFQILHPILTQKREPSEIFCQPSRLSRACVPAPRYFS